MGSLARHVISAAILLFCVTATGAAYADWVVKGRRLSWEMSAPSDDWFGGNYDQLKRASEASDDPGRRSLYELLLEELRSRDAALYYMPDWLELRDKPSSFTTKTLTAIRINVLYPAAEAYDLMRKEPQTVFDAGGGMVGAPPGTSVTRTDLRSYQVDHRDAYEVAYRVVLPQGGQYYEVHLLVLVKEGTVHFFVLKVDSTRLEIRREEFRRMVKTLRYTE